MSLAPVILVAPSLAALRAVFGVRKRDDGSDDVDTYGPVPNADWWGSRHTPPCWKMIDGTPYTDPDTGQTVTPRVRDGASTKFALVVVLEVADALALKAQFPGHVFNYTGPGLANAMAAHPELEWGSLGQMAGWPAP